KVTVSKWTLARWPVRYLTLLSWKYSFRYAFTRSTAVRRLKIVFHALEPLAGALYRLRSLVILIFHTFWQTPSFNNGQSLHSFGCVYFKVSYFVSKLS